ncbi:NfeD family protein [Pseudomonas saliphila]|uniref:NfeD family protein n=1 Tax=Pseudomonas saliphila TaxID=2586906 RepID=UPI00123A0519|nr:nodulation protein NfeD [Pseudomonas saliphila]
MRYLRVMLSNTPLAWFWAGLLLLGVVMFAASSGPGLLAQEQEGSPSALILSVDGPIGPATMDYIVRGIEQAEEEQARVVVIEMDTPGGLMESMRLIIREILRSPVPIITYVTPAGARAASAGTYILYASHIAAMAPSTHLGSATPVQMGGLPGSPDPATEPGESEGENGASEKTEPRRGGSAMERKLLEDSVAYIRSLAERHDRNADWAEQAVREAVNLGATEALERDVIEVVASSLDDLLAQVDGRSVRMADGERTLATSDLTLIRVDPNWRTRLLTVITNPNIAYFLMLIGFYGIIFELSNPGNLYPGIIGGICLILALFSFQVLTVNYAGLALILLGLVLIVAEAFLPSFGTLGIGGIVAFVIGSIILMDGSHQPISLPMIGGMAAIFGALLLWTVTRVLTLRRRPAVSGTDRLINEQGVALDDFSRVGERYQGYIQVGGERWKAVSQSPIQTGQPVSIARVEGLTLHLKPTVQEPVAEQ